MVLFTVCLAENNHINDGKKHMIFINVANDVKLWRKIINCYVCTNIQEINIIPSISVF